MDLDIIPDSHACIDICTFTKDTVCANFYLIADLPDNASAVAGAMTASASGAMRISTTVLLTPEEIDAAAKLKPTFRAPGA